MVNTLKYQKELESLKVEHSLLQGEINTLMRNKVVDHFTMNDLKKKIVLIKESINYLANTLFEDNSAA